MDSLATTQISTLLNYEQIHIELSSRCTLKCPRCPRTELHPDGLNKDISLEEFKKAFTPDLLLKVHKLVFCGNTGDPIYARDFIEIIAYIKSISDTRLTIVTNGSYRSVEWWTKLGKLLSEHDQVTFSVDGWDQASNEQYRVNCNFDSIVEGAKALRLSSPCSMNWSAIYFSFNQYDFSKMRQVAIDLGFDSFQRVKSTKFNGDYAVNGVDELEPDVEFLSTQPIYDVEFDVLSNRYIPVNIYFTKSIHPWARCVNRQKEMFINVDGLVFPCPWFYSGYQQNDFVEKHRDRINIKTRTLLEILEDPLWEELVTRFEIAPLDICKIKCYDCK